MTITELIEHPDTAMKLGIDIRSRKRKTHQLLEKVTRLLYVKALDLLDYDADFRSVMAHASTDAASMQYCEAALNSKVEEILREL